jgi:ATP-dependent DNA helicase PIF1
MNDELNELNAEQAAILDAVLEGRNVFFTGNAGTGKTFLLKRIVDALRQKHGDNFGELVAITATTGIAATHIAGGTTLNAALGVGAPNLYRDFRAMHRIQNRSRIRRWKTLIIDECSMLSAEFFEEMEASLCEVRDSTLPAGGLQLVIAGDFFQLPPVTKLTMPGTPADAFLNFGYAFQAPAWRRSKLEHVLLTRVYRQKDAEFLSLLDAVRDGRHGKKAIRRLVELCGRPLDVTSGIKPTQIFSRNKDVDDMNTQELAKLPGAKVAFGSKDDVVLETHLRAPGAEKAMGEALLKLKRSEFFRDCQAGSSLRLCVGAQVMLLKNLDMAAGLVNGSRGVVVGFAPLSGAPMVRFACAGPEAIEVPAVKFSSTFNGAGECMRMQVPLKLAWAITVHKSQGMTLDLVRISLRSIFAVGQAYVALSRARSIEGLEIIDWDENCARTDPAVSAFHNKLVAAVHAEDHIDDPAWTAWRAGREAAASAAK